MGTGSMETDPWSADMPAESCDLSPRFPDLTPRFLKKQMITGINRKLSQMIMGRKPPMKFSQNILAENKSSTGNT
jgi:hypothetical protein